MKVCFVTDMTLNEFWEKNQQTGQELIVFSFSGLGIVSYRSELDGTTGYFEDLALMSKELDCTIICGCQTDTCGVLRLSAAVADCGKILGVSDMVHIIDNKPYECGNGFRVYDTKAGKVGVLVATDLFFAESTRVLALSECDLIVCVFENLTDTLPQITMRAHAFANGIAFAMCANGYAQIAGVCGKVLFASPSAVSNFNLDLIKDYHLIKSRQKGLYCQIKNSY